MNNFSDLDGSYHFFLENLYFYSARATEKPLNKSKSPKLKSHYLVATRGCATVRVIMWLTWLGTFRLRIWLIFRIILENSSGARRPRSWDGNSFSYLQLRPNIVISPIPFIVLHFDDVMVTSKTMTHKGSSRDVKVPLRMIGGGMLSICWAKEDESLYFLKPATFTTAKYRIKIVLLYLRSVNRSR